MGDASGEQAVAIRTYFPKPNGDCLTCAVGSDWAAVHGCLERGAAIKQRESTSSGG